MKILLVKSVFCPNDIYYETTIKTLIKLNMFIGLIKHKKNKKQIDEILTVDVYCIGWIHTFNNKMESFFETNLNEFDSVDTNFFYHNYGKYHIFNQLIEYVKNHHCTYDLIIYTDHDIYFDMACTQDISLFMNLQFLKNHIIKDKHLGLIAFNQKKDNRHKKDIYENNSVFLNYHIIYPSCIGSIASGGFMIFPEVLIQIKCFELLSVYGLDDYYLVEKLTSMNYLNVVIENLHVIHPYDNNDEYMMWKKNKIIKMIIKNDENYHQQVQESINFWSNIQ